MFKFESYSGHRLYMDFKMNLSVIRCNEYSQVGSTKTVANWRAWYTDPLNVIAEQELKGMRADLVYHVSTVLVSPFQILTN